ncbi:hypothetical protein Cflav_PD5021 [Pedosphaera parvula Ellin514]|uniref:Uncharacterized protein n=1 Tax=Pedosphaera parvula (strain Ellin514) TaxID=320771 RepID=B9XD40_PEDPL|nr:hypothetical protein Cflav_PD5021 [Pedosphaera parvula Ellin514]
MPSPQKQNTRYRPDPPIKTKIPVHAHILNQEVGHSLSNPKKYTPTHQPLPKTIQTTQAVPHFSLLHTTNVRPSTRIFLAAPNLRNLVRLNELNCATFHSAASINARAFPSSANFPKI